MSKIEIKGPNITFYEVIVIWSFEPKIDYFYVFQSEERGKTALGGFLRPSDSV